VQVSFYPPMWYYVERLNSRTIMAVTLNLSNETERRLRELATRAGLTLEGYLQSLAEREATIKDGPLAELMPKQWSAEWRAWANADRHLQAGLVIDDSREGIYAGRGELVPSTSSPPSLP
jgi:hypothetical protein